ncbi:hypothetical protein G6F46_009061 [Rhizopus delemar]|nr:hypothetical protein G6F55_007954 [Rhizopus delemar]KAG1539327.1 hypothetical protein G6F51_009206 [Rhizopus arrhizus]KAG1525883.1 hypothetical protein G6F52_002928 [Rhizopus delemar]KAG1553667.1 hypothetical protein G6F49_008298 [Rhizopus delemar]KAG1566627.1 hypothetical protein G6F50_008970 [Rhizopus delemar]
MNVLILSKVWYTLRLLRPTVGFFKALNKQIYQFIWQNKSPKLKKELIYLPFEYGGLKVFDPCLQHKILQKRWLNYLINPERYHSFVHPYMLQHLSLFNNASEYPWLPLLNSSYRKSVVYSRTLSVWETIFTTMDYFIPTDFNRLPSPIPLLTILQLPLHMVINVTSDHWSHRHPTFLTSLMFVFDNQQNRLRLRVDGEHSRYPRLYRQLFDDILNRQTVTIQECVWDHILSAPSNQQYPETSQLPLIKSLRMQPKWINFHPRLFRQNFQEMSVVTHRFQRSVIRKFWHSKLHPQARTVYCRTIHKRIPTQTFISKYSPLVSSCCSLCGLADDTFRHFVIDCPRKWEVWLPIISQYFPNYNLSSEILYGALAYLHVPRNIREVQRFFTVIGITHWQLWNMYWHHGNTNTHVIAPQNIQNVTQRIKQLIDALLTHG